MSKRWHHRGIGIVVAAAMVFGIGHPGDTAPASRTRPATLEDLYGDTGNRFQGAIGFQVREAQAPTEAAAGFGVAVDDVVLTWREFTLEDDATDCDASGACATISLQTNNIFSGNTVLTVEVVDATPDPANDCDLDGTFDGTRDCDGNGLDDVVVKVNSAREPAGEIVILNRSGPAAYRGQLPLSSSFDLPGVIFVYVDGNLNATVTATYLDRDDGTGTVCQNNVDPDSWGRVQTTSTVFLTSAAVLVTRSIATDNGDDDGWADDFETVSMRVEVSNKSGIALTGVALRATSNDPAIACVTVPFLEFGDLAAGETRFSEAAFQFTMAEVGRETAFENLTATLNISVDSDQFQSTLQPQSITFDLDLDGSGGSGPTTYFEGFESGLGSFTAMQIDEDLNPPDDDLGNLAAGVINADGHRCQYSDPDWERSVPFGSGAVFDCFPNPTNTPDNFWWQITTDRAYSGAASLYWGVVLDPSLGFSTPIGQLEAVRTADPVNMGFGSVCEIDRSVACTIDADCPGDPVQACVAALPTLTFKHQVSMMDHRTINAQRDRGPQRGVVAGQLADGGGAGFGDWVKLVPYVNTYDSQANSNYFNCTFDPTDDGNTEESFFDPADPARFQGPSSTCAPEFSFIHQGDTGLPFSDQNIGDATDGPGLQGAKGLGTWVESKVDLGRFRGRRLYLRFLATNLDLGSVLHWEQIFVFNPDPRDDGWFIDDVQVSDALSTPADVGPDLKDNTALPGCGSGCAFVSAIVVATPAASAAPGQVIVLDAGASDVPRCIDGVPQYFFAVDVDGDGVLIAGRDVVLRDWTDDESLLVTPQGDVDYLVGVRCGSEPACADIVATSIEVACPTGPAGLGSGSSAQTAFLGREPTSVRHVRFSSLDRLSWASAATVDVIRGDLATLRANRGFAGAGEIVECVADNAVAAADAPATVTPPLGAAYFYLVRSAERCNQKAGGSWGQVGEEAPRDTGIATENAACAE